MQKRNAHFTHVIAITNALKHENYWEDKRRTHSGHVFACENCNYSLLLIVRCSTLGGFLHSMIMYNCSYY